MLDEPTARAFAIVITAVGGPALLISLGRTINKWWTGRSDLERQRNKEILTDLQSMEYRANQEASLKRNALEYASELRRQLTEAGLTPLPWPNSISMNSKRNHK